MNQISKRATLARSLRFLRHVRGWGRLVNFIVPRDASGDFVVVNDGTAFAGNLRSLIDRQVYLFGNYEDNYLAQFLTFVPKNRRGVVLDVGANVGTHSQFFARHFNSIHSFEPNPMLWSAFNRNMALNAIDNVHLHEVGLGAKDEVLMLHLTEHQNFGLGTFSTLRQYDVPLRPTSNCKVVNGDDFLASIGVSTVDAIKIDVQGFEPEVVQGLQRLLERSRPPTWFEMGHATGSRLKTIQDVQALFPYPITLHKLGRVKSFDNAPISDRNGNLPIGDYVALP